MDGFNWLLMSHSVYYDRLSKLKKCSVFNAIWHRNCIYWWEHNSKIKTVTPHFILSVVSPNNLSAITSQPSQTKSYQLLLQKNIHKVAPYKRKDNIMHVIRHQIFWYKVLCAHIQKSLFAKLDGLNTSSQKKDTGSCLLQQFHSSFKLTTLTILCTEAVNHQSECMHKYSRVLKRRLKKRAVLCKQAKS